MTAQAGKDLLLKLGDGAASQSFASVAGLRARSLKLNAHTIDSTHADSPGRWRELIGGAGVRSASIAGSGIFVDAQSDADVRAVFFAQDRADWRVIIPGFGLITGPFLITGLEYAGRHDGEATYSLALESAGELVFAAL
ncbi:MAG: phage major tail protein, TP901-1 family [Pseudomonadota bacterium]